MLHHGTPNAPLFPSLRVRLVISYVIRKKKKKPMAMLENSNSMRKCLARGRRHIGSNKPFCSLFEVWYWTQRKPVNFGPAWILRKPSFFSAHSLRKVVFFSITKIWGKYIYVCIIMSSVSITCYLKLDQIVTYNGDTYVWIEVNKYLFSLNNMIG